MAKTPWSDIIGAAITGILLPEVLDIIKKHQAAHNGEIPTEASIKAELDARCDGGIARGEQFLEAHGGL